MLQAKESQTVEMKEIWRNFSAPLLLSRDSIFIWCVDLRCFLIQIFSSSIHVGDVYCIYARHPNSSMSPRFMKPLRMVLVSASLLSNSLALNVITTPWFLIFLARYLETSSTSTGKQTCRNADCGMNNALFLGFRMTQFRSIFLNRHYI